ncbi:hypothetical protein BD626DRAFT_602898 [Schizophyllum amplum]|uniref:Uncharacterized protein n=1 Tax=Schizophyllum amplum TaxID=97359 RepID=A0A550CV47_9AGAR|nr:hypothetical protein BD626DRAFT_602898 [Auriculariopsis ampla]
MVKARTNKQMASTAGPSQLRSDASRRGHVDRGVVIENKLHSSGPSSLPVLSAVRSPRTAFLKRGGVSASGDEILKWIGDFRLREDRPNYGFDIADFNAIDSNSQTAGAIWSKAINHGPVYAHRLVSLVIRGNNSVKTTREQLADMLKAVVAPDLETIKILRPGISSGSFEEALYGFLSAPSERATLKHVSLCWCCCYQTGLSKYLESAAASRLVLLHLQTNAANVKDTILHALAGGHRFPNLRRLSLQNIQGLTAKNLLDALQTRYMRGHRRPLSVEITSDVSTDISKRARVLQITMKRIGPDDLLVKPAKRVKEELD